MYALEFFQSPEASAAARLLWRAALGVQPDGVSDTAARQRVNCRAHFVALTQLLTSVEAQLRLVPLYPVHRQKATRHTLEAGHASAFW